MLLGQLENLNRVCEFNGRVASMLIFRLVALYGLNVGENLWESYTRAFREDGASCQNHICIYVCHVYI